MKFLKELRFRQNLVDAKEGWQMVKARLSMTARLAFFFASPRLFYLLKAKTEMLVTNYLTKIRDSKMLTICAKIETARPEKFHKNFARPVFLKGPFTTPQKGVLAL